MKPFFKLTDGLDALIAQGVVHSITGQMTVFPMCCSTGVVKGLGATALVANSKQYVEGSEPFTCDKAVVQKATAIHTLLRQIHKAGGRRMLLPAEAGAWYALSLILTKVTTGTDDGNIVGYSNYKAAQVAMFDRINEDKRNGKRFNTYNTTWSVDQMVDFLVDHPELGETLASDPRDGAHGARVRGCIFTPDIPALRKFHDARLAELKEHILYMMNEYKGEAPKAVDSVAALF